MNKKALTALSVAAAAVFLIGCTAPTSNIEQAQQAPETRIQTEAADTPTPIPAPNPPPLVKFNISGVRRHYEKSLAGEYSVEYIHCAKGNIDLDCKLTVNDDNSYEMSFIKDGDTVEHSGKWYSRRGNVTFFFDEPKPTYVPEVYYPDSISADILDRGKLMMYDGCCIIVLSQNKTAQNNG